MIEQSPARLTNIAYQPVFLIGAARSGTKLVRDLIAEHPQVDKVPYDINYIWRVGNESCPDDELTPQDLNRHTQKRIRSLIESYRSGKPVLIEKTVSNCLRIAFVHQVFPNAKFIHLLRDPVDVVESVYRQWLVPPDFKYVLQKALTFPFGAAFGYGLRYVSQYARKLIAPNGGKIAVWGPRYRNIEQDLQTRDLIDVCTLQWLACFERARLGLGLIPQEFVFTLHYEDFVACPRFWLSEIAVFLAIDSRPYTILDLSEVHLDNIGKGRRNLSESQLACLRSIIDTVVE